MLTDKIIQMAINSANKSDSVLYRHGAVLFDKKEIISSGYNSLNYNDDALTFSPYAKFHAEALCLYRAYGGRTRKGSNKVYMLVIRLNKHGIFRLSFPCPTCLELIRKNRVSRVYYSTDNGILNFAP
jgi:tRNA(Arg) A34 adenosine deaminase TadA